MKTSIYVLKNENGDVKNVGKTSRSLLLRLKEHINEAKRGVINHRCFGIRKMLRDGFQPTIELLFEVDGDGSKEEIEQIKKFRDLGIVLWNGTDGGDGVTMTEEIRDKISKSRKGYKASKEAVKKNREGHKGQKGFWKGKNLYEEAKIKMSKSHIGKKSGMKGRRHTLKSRKKMSKSLKGRVVWNKGLRRENVCLETLRLRKYYK